MYAMETTPVWGSALLRMARGNAVLRLGRWTREVIGEEG